MGLWSWLRKRLYAGDMGFAPQPTRKLSTIKAPENLSDFEGQWVAVRGGVVIASADTARELASVLRGIGRNNEGIVHAVRVGASRGLPSRGGVRGIATERFHAFPYREEEELVAPGGIRTGKRIERPTLDVLLASEWAEWPTRALVDTGAPRNIFSRGCAEALGIDLSPPHPRKRTHVLLGQSWDAIPVMVCLTLEPFIDLSWETEVDFLLAEWDMPFGILGTQGFLDRWAVTFNRYHNYFVVQEVEIFEERLGSVDTFLEFQKTWDGWDRPES